jgi:biopolymer transport protein ExbB
MIMRQPITRFLGCLLLGLAAGLTMLPSAAHAWWNDDWSLRKEISIDTSAAGANISDPIGETPVLVRLHVGNFKFDSAKDDGSDIRFVAADDKTPLKFHIEKFDPLLGEGFVWVDVPDLKPGAKSSIWLYYGNKKAVAAADPKGTYDPDTVLVYHFGEHGTPAQDQTRWGNNAQTVGQASDGSFIGPGLRLDGQTTVTIPASPSLAWADGAAMTWSAWIKMDAAQPNAVVFSRRDGANAFIIGLGNGAPFVEVTNASGTQRSPGGAAIQPNSWHQLTVVTGPQIALYLDGSPYATLNVALPALNAAALIGGDAGAAATPAPAANAAAPAPGTEPTPAPAPAAPAPATPDAAQPGAPAAPPAAASTSPYVGLVGEMDELEISKVARPLGYIKAAAIGQGADPGKFLTLGIDEETASWLSGYFAVILRSVTLDGWVVIGLLMIMAVISWVVMADKAAYLGRLGKANDQFMKNFRHVAADLTILDRGDAEDVSSLGGRISAADAKMMRFSSLYRVYHIGAAEIRARFAEGGERALSAESIEAIRAGLDAGLVRENQRLNRLMVLLTIAISGGPFLGLLGTVIGVMITFASIAAAGDVNVNAIAPGIAAALVATVAGLFVAIPALFGYNYLTSRIRDSSSDMQVFVDQLVTKMAELYRQRPDHRPQPLAAE